MSKYSGSKFEDSLSMIPEAIMWAENQNVERLSRFLLESANVPLYLFGSGGNSSANDYAALLYETNEGMAKSLTPLAMTSISDKALQSAKIFITCGSGQGQDEKYTVPRAAALNPQGVCGLTRSNDGGNLLVNTFKEVTTNWFQYDWPSQDSFIATVSTIARFALFYKAFTNDNEFLSKLDLDLRPSHCFSYAPRIEGANFKDAEGREFFPKLSEIRNFIVLYSGWSRPVAVDFESKMIECGIASVQLCDYRNFCHGRFIFPSKHLEDSVLMLFLTPKEIGYADSLILKAKTHRGDRDLFPPQTPIIKIQSKLDNALAPIDLLIKMNVCFCEIAKAFGDEPCNPKNPYDIHKEVPRSRAIDSDILVTLDSGVQGGSKGTLKGVSRKKAIDYDPSKSVEELARLNGVSVPTIWSYIKEHRIDRSADARMLTYNKVWLRYIKDSDQSVLSMARKLKLSENTVKSYLSMSKPDFKVADGKVTTVGEDDKLIKLREKLESAPLRFARVKKIQEKHPQYDLETILEKLPLTSNKSNTYQIGCFMQMSAFDTDIKKRYYKFSKGDIEYIKNRAE